MPASPQNPSPHGGLGSGTKPHPPPPVGDKPASPQSTDWLTHGGQAGWSGERLGDVGSILVALERLQAAEGLVPRAGPSASLFARNLCPVRAKKAKVTKFEHLGVGYPEHFSLALPGCPEVNESIARTPPEPGGDTHRGRSNAKGRAPSTSRPFPRPGAPLATSIAPRTGGLCSPAPFIRG